MFAAATPSRNSPSMYRMFQSWTPPPAPAASGSPRATPRRTSRGTCRTPPATAQRARRPKAERARRRTGRARVSIAAQFPRRFQWKNRRSPGLRASPRAARRRTSLRSESRWGPHPPRRTRRARPCPPFPGSERRASGTLSNARAASTTRARRRARASTRSGAPGTHAPARVTSSYAGIEKLVRERGVGVAAVLGCPHAQPRGEPRRDSVARRSTTEDMRCGTAMDWLYADHPILGSASRSPAPARGEAGTPSASAPRRGAGSPAGSGRASSRRGPPEARPRRARGRRRQRELGPGAGRARARRARHAARRRRRWPPAAAGGSLAATSTAQVAGLDRRLRRLGIARCTSFPSSNATSCARSSHAVEWHRGFYSHWRRTVLVRARRAAPAGAARSMLPPSSACAPAAQPDVLPRVLLGAARGAASIQPAASRADPPRAAGLCARLARRKGDATPDRHRDARDAWPMYQQTSNVGAMRVGTMHAVEHATVVAGVRVPSPDVRGVVVSVTQATGNRPASARCFRLS